MLGLEFYTDNGLVQLSDKTPSLGFLRKAGADESNIGWDERYYNYAEVYGAGGKYFFAPISQLSVWENSGLEVYSERGELMFSSAMKLLSFVRSFSVDVPNNQHRPFVHVGEAGRRYGVMLIKSQSRQHYKNVRFSPGRIIRLFMMMNGIMMCMSSHSGPGMAMAGLNSLIPMTICVMRPA